MDSVQANIVDASLPPCIITVGHENGAIWNASAVLKTEGHLAVDPVDPRQDH